MAIKTSEIYEIISYLTNPKIPSWQDLTTNYQFVSFTLLYLSLVIVLLFIAFRNRKNQNINLQPKAIDRIHEKITPALAQFIYNEQININSIDTLLTCTIINLTRKNYISISENRSPDTEQSSVTIKKGAVVSDKLSLEESCFMQILEEQGGIITLSKGMDELLILQITTIDDTVISNSEIHGIEGMGRSTICLSLILLVFLLFSFVLLPVSQAGYALFTAAMSLIFGGLMTIAHRIRLIPYINFVTSVIVWYGFVCNKELVIQLSAAAIIIGFYAARASHLNLKELSRKAQKVKYHVQCYKKYIEAENETGIFGEIDIFSSDDKSNMEKLSYAISFEVDTHNNSVEFLKKIINISMGYNSDLDK